MCCLVQRQTFKAEFLDVVLGQIYKAVQINMRLQIGNTAEGNGQF